MLEMLRRARPEEDPAPGDRPRQRGRLHPQHARRRQEPEPRGRALRHLPGDAPGRAADGRHGGGDVQVAVLRPGALRPLGRRPREDEHAPRPRRRGHGARAPQGGHHRGHPHAGRPARRPRRDRRHRQSRQPPGALGRRADGEPVPHRPAAHGARDQGAHVVGRDRHRHAAGPDQRQAGGRGGARVLRLLAALAVHGPDEPAVGDHPQAAPLGARAGRSYARARRLRGARRAPDALRPHLPDRDAGRAEYRPHQLARDLRARQQVRLHREPLPQDRRRPGDATRWSTSRPWRRRNTRSRRRTRSSTGRAASSTTWSPAGMPATCRCSRARRSTSWTCRRSSSFRWRRRSSRSSRTTTPTAR